MTISAVSAFTRSGIQDAVKREVFGGRQIRAGSGPFYLGCGAELWLLGYFLICTRKTLYFGP